MTERRDQVLFNVAVAAASAPPKVHQHRSLDTIYVEWAVMRAARVCGQTRPWGRIYFSRTQTKKPLQTVLTIWLIHIFISSLSGWIGGRIYARPLAPIQPKLEELLNVCFAVINFQLHQMRAKFISANKLVGVHENDNIIVLEDKCRNKMFKVQMEFNSVLIRTLQAALRGLESLLLFSVYRRCHANL